MTVQSIIDALWSKVLEDLTGLIAIWSGAIVDIPEGWHLCDGTNGTADLRDQFVVGAGNTYDPGNTGGSATHQHSVTIAPHSHTMPGGDDINEGVGNDKTTNAVPLTGSALSSSSLPPYYSLAFIQKI